MWYKRYIENIEHGQGGDQIEITIYSVMIKLNDVLALKHRCCSIAPKTE